MTYHVSAVPRRVLIDTSAYFASIDADDQHHREAIEIATRLATARPRLLTTNYLIAETHALLLARLGHHEATRFLSEMAQSDTVIVRVSARDERRALEIVFRYDNKDFSLTDATSFAVMERLRIRDAFSFDRNFEQFGFRVLRR